MHTTRRHSKTTNSAVRELTEFKKITSGKEHELRMEQMKEEHKLKMKVLNEQLEVFKTVKNILMTNPSSLHVLDLVLIIIMYKFIKINICIYLFIYNINKYIKNISIYKQ